MSDADRYMVLSGYDGRVIGWPDDMGGAGWRDDEVCGG